MKHLQLQYQDKTLECHLPESWQEVNVEQYYRLQKWDKKSTIGLFAALSGHDQYTLGNITEKSGKALEAHLSISYWGKPDFERYKDAKTVPFFGRDIEVPKSLEWETYGQYEMARQEISKTQDDAKLIAPLCGIYLQKAYDGNFVPSKVSMFTEQVKKTPIEIIYPLYSFFFKKLRAYRRFGLIDLIRWVAQTIRRSKIYTLKQPGGPSSSNHLLSL